MRSLNEVIKVTTLRDLIDGTLLNGSFERWKAKPTLTHVVIKVYWCEVTLFYEEYMDLVAKRRIENHE